MNHAMFFNNFRDLMLINLTKILKLFGTHLCRILAFWAQIVILSLSTASFGSDSSSGSGAQEILIPKLSYDDPALSDDQNEILPPRIPEFRVSFERSPVLQESVFVNLNSRAKNIEAQMLSCFGSLEKVRSNYFSNITCPSFKANLESLYANLINFIVTRGGIKTSESHSINCVGTTREKIACFKFLNIELKNELESFSSLSPFNDKHLWFIEKLPVEDVSPLLVQMILQVIFSQHDFASKTTEILNRDFALYRTSYCESSEPPPCHLLC